MKVEALSIYSFFFSFFNAALPTGTYRHSTDYVNTYWTLDTPVGNSKRTKRKCILHFDRSFDKKNKRQKLSEMTPSYQ